MQKRLNRIRKKEKAKFKTTFYYFILMLILMNTRAIQWNNPHIFSLIIIIMSISIILFNKLSTVEDDFKFRYQILGVVSAIGVYDLEIILN